MRGFTEPKNQSFDLLFPKATMETPIKYLFFFLQNVNLLKRKSYGNTDVKIKLLVQKPACVTLGDNMCQGCWS